MSPVKEKIQLLFDQKIDELHDFHEKIYVELSNIHTSAGRKSFLPLLVCSVLNAINSIARDDTIGDKLVKSFVADMLLTHAAKREKEEKETNPDLH